MSDQPTATQGEVAISLFFSQVGPDQWVYSARDQFGNEVFSDWNWQTLEEALTGAYAMSLAASSGTSIDDQNDAIRAEVEKALPAPIGGYESDDDADAHRAAQDALFNRLTAEWEPAKHGLPPPKARRRAPGR